MVQHSDRRQTVVYLRLCVTVTVTAKEKRLPLSEVWNGALKTNTDRHGIPKLDPHISLLYFIFAKFIGAALWNPFSPASIRQII